VRKRGEREEELEITTPIFGALRTEATTWTSAWFALTFPLSMQHTSQLPASPTLGNQIYFHYRSIPSTLKRYAHIVVCEAAGPG